MHEMNEKPSEWIDTRARELCREEYGNAPEGLKREFVVQAILNYLDAQHAARKAAEKRYAETEPELPY